MAKSKAADAGDVAGARRILLLNRWLRAVASLLDAERACIVLTDDTISRVIARHGIPHAFIATTRPQGKAPYPTADEVVIGDAANRADIQAFMGDIAGPALGFFYRLPLTSRSIGNLALLVLGDRPRPDVAPEDLALVRELAARMSEEAERQFAEGSGTGVETVGMNLADLSFWLAGTDLPAALLDAELRLTAVNDRMRTVLPASWPTLIGTPLGSWQFPAAESLDFLFRHALASGVSTPRVDVTLDGGNLSGMPPGFVVRGAPITTADGTPMLIATVDPASATLQGMSEVGGLVRQEAATVEFLLTTLVHKRSLRSRNGVSYLTLRSWRQSIREHQISALRAIKRHTPLSIAAEIAGEIADDVRSLMGIGGFRAIVPMPCGHSRPGKCLSALIGQALGAEIGLPVINALKLPFESGGSHPRTNAKRAPMQLLTPVDGPVLLIDDVSTSGRHIEEAMGLLRKAKVASMAVAWIGGDAAKDD
jgi:hypothetical protein